LQNALINEIFSGIQGEGPYIGEKQLFIRFCDCNLNCAYCDTDYSKQNGIEYTPDELYEVVKTYPPQTISLTGGEPLLWTNFLGEFLEKYSSKLGSIYLETNGTLPEELEKIVQYIDIVSMDIKLKSACGENIDHGVFDDFLSIAKNNTCSSVFSKVIFDNNINDAEINKVIKLAKRYDILVVLQPKMPLDMSPDEMEEIFNKFYSKYHNIRLIPQTHKFLNLR